MNLIELKNCTVKFKKNNVYFNALNNINFGINNRNIVGIVGESGSGKSTLARLIVGLLTPTFGKRLINGVDNKNSKYQMVFQDPASSMNPRLNVYQIIKEALTKNESELIIEDILRRVGLNNTYLKRYPHQLSGGEQQRICIARSIVNSPKLVVFDEAVSALDMSTQGQIINLVKDIYENNEFIFLFISHDISVIKFLSSRIIVMYMGEIIEDINYLENNSEFYHPYSKCLQSSIPSANPDIKLKRIKIKGDVPNILEPTDGCGFSPRCPVAEEKCFFVKPDFIKYNNNYLSCHYPDNDL